MLLRPDAGLEPERLVDIFLSDSSGYPYGVSSYPDYREYRDRTSEVFSAVAVHQTSIAHYREGDSSEYLMGEIVTGNFFEVMGIPRPHRTHADTRGRREPRWASRRRRERDVLARSVRSGFRNPRRGARAQRTCVHRRGGRTPKLQRDVAGLERELLDSAAMVDHVNPMSSDGASRLERRTNRSWFAKGAASPRVTLEQAQAQMDSLSASLQEELPDAYGERTLQLLPSEDVRLHPIVDGALFSVAGVLMRSSASFS